MSRIGVFGLGNVLRRDDGFGPAVVRRLEDHYDFGAEVVVRDLGTPGLDLAMHVWGLESVIFIDTIEAPGDPGSLRVLDGSVLRSSRCARLTMHEGDVGEALQTAELAGAAPRTVTLVAAIPADLAMGPGFSPEIAAACDKACTLVLTELERLGHRPARRKGSATPGWWENG